MSINEACPSVSTIPIVIPSAQRLKPVSNPDLWEYNPEELVRFTPLRKFSSSANTSTVWSHFKIHTSKEYADKAWCDYCHRPFSREHSTLSRHIERHHKDQMKNAEVSVVCSKQEKTILTAKKSQFEQYFTTQVPFLTKFEHDEAMKLLAHAWCENLLPQFLLTA